MLVGYCLPMVQCIYAARVPPCYLLVTVFLVFMVPLLVGFRVSVLIGYCLLRIQDILDGNGTAFLGFRVSGYLCWLPPS